MRFFPTSGYSSDEQSPMSTWAKVATTYLYIPLILFIAGWLKLWISIPVLACIAASGVLLFCCYGKSSSSLFERCNLVNTAIIAMIAIVFALLNGVIDWVPQSTDYLKHNLILGDLIENPWPPRYTTPEGGSYLCYGLGYYMVPATFAKIFGASTVGAAGFIWTALGLFLFFQWLLNRFERNQILGIGIFLLSCGLGVCWYLLKSGPLLSMLDSRTASFVSINMLEVGLFTSNLDSFTRFFYQPQHALPAWLGGALIYDLIDRRCWTESAAVLAATLFWSPLTAIVLAVIGLVAFITHHGKISLRPTIHLVTALLVTSVLIAYYLPHLPILEKGWIWNLTDKGSWVIWYILFVTVFVGVPVSAIVWMEIKRPYLGPLKPVLLGMIVVLLVSPLFKLGYFSDLRMQVSGPAFLFVALAIAKGLVEAPVPRLSPCYLYLAVVFLAGAAAPIFRTFDNLASGPRNDYRIASLREKHLSSILDLQMTGFDVTTQYLGRSDSALARWILKTPGL